MSARPIDWVNVLAWIVAVVMTVATWTLIGVMVWMAVY